MRKREERKMKICDLNIKLFLIYLIFTNGWAALNEKIVVICSVVFSWVIVPTTTTTTTTLYSKLTNHQII